MPLKDLTGQRYGRLVVISRAPNVIRSDRTCVAWNVECECGNTINKFVGGLSHDKLFESLQ